MKFTPADYRDRLHAIPPRPGMDTPNTPLSSLTTTTRRSSRLAPSEALAARRRAVNVNTSPALFEAAKRDDDKPSADQILL